MGIYIEDAQSPDFTSDPDYEVTTSTVSAFAMEREDFSTSRKSG
jgi:hypothetical protein